MGPIMLDVEGLSLSVEDKELLQQPVVGGLILFSRNYDSVSQLKELVAEIRSVNKDLMIAVDQEGGRVQRFKEGFTRLPPLQKIGQLYQKDNAQGEEAAYWCAWLMAVEVLSCGIDFSFAPVLDVDECDCEVISDRSFANSAELVGLLGESYIKGMHDAGMGGYG